MQSSAPVLIARLTVTRPCSSGSRGTLCRVVHGATAPTANGPAAAAIVFCVSRCTTRSVYCTPALAAATAPRPIPVATAALRVTFDARAAPAIPAPAEALSVYTELQPLKSAIAAATSAAAANRRIVFCISAAFLSIALCLLRSDSMKHALRLASASARRVAPRRPRRRGILQQWIQKGHSKIAKNCKLPAWANRCGDARELAKAGLRMHWRIDDRAVFRPSLFRPPCRCCC